MADGPELPVKVTVLVTNWNGGDVLRECLQSLAYRTEGVAYETIVVDDASTDGSAEMIQREFPAVRLLARTVNAGFVRANNAGAELAGGRYLLLLNSDTILVNNAVALMAEYLDRHDGVGACGGLLMSRDGTPQISFGCEPSLVQALADALFLNDLFPRARFPARGIVPGGDLRSPIAVDYISGADLMIRRDLVTRLGLFDTSFEAYCEEVDLCRRVRRQGNMEVHFIPGAGIIHLGGFSYGKLGRRRIAMQCRSQGLFLRKHHGGVYAAVVTLLFAWHYAVKLAFRSAMWAAARGARRAFWRESARDAWSFVHSSLGPGRRTVP
jgi:GT2 family glycosyltransferase